MNKKKSRDQESKEIKVDDTEIVENESEDLNHEETKESKASEESETGNEKDIIIKELEEKVKSLEDSLLRKVAEFENYKRRTENDQLNLLKYAAESFILKILPIYDDLQRSVDHIKEDNNDSVNEGLKLVLNKFKKIFEEQGIKKMEVKGEEFNVDFHEALMQQLNNEVPANTVLEEIEAGYIYKDKVIRHAKVIVSQSEEAKNENDDLTNEIEE